MVRVSLEELWMVSDRIVDFHFFVKFHFLNSHATCYLCIKKASNQAKEFINMVSITLEGLRMVSDRIVDFRFFVKFQKSGPVIIFSFFNSHTCQLCIKKAPNQAKDFINMVSVTLKGLRTVSHRIVDFRFFVKFHMSGPVIIFSF